MNETSLSLLQQLRDSPQNEAWDRLHRIYEPLIRAWLRKYEVQGSDADDLAQEVLLAVSQEIGAFDHSGRQGAFRTWLKGILINRLRNFWRTRDRRREVNAISDVIQRLDELENPASALSQLWNDEHDQFVLGQLLTTVKPNFAEQTWNAFLRTALQGENPREVALQLGISLNAIIIAKSRVLSRLRQESDGVVDSFSRFSGGD